MSVSRVLIANRGEIARRIIRACRRLGLRTIAVYSEADRCAPFVREADLALPIGPAHASQSYLDQEVLLAAARRADADAVHPGYGFLAENAAFAEACLETGLTFIGPAPHIIRRMGSKIEAKRIATKAGVPTVPGYDGADGSDAALLAAAREIGPPLLVKASAGGGGRGMRVVRTNDALLDQILTARREAEAAFGDGSLLLERFVEGGRHIEVQVLGDGHGKVVHLFERDCSLQRNHQKVIEEAPAPDLPRDLRKAILESALRLARAIGYDSAGTVEFLVERNKDAFYFLEMNTRLQVEHPVTEKVTGVDIVERQLRIASGEPLDLDQANVTCSGSAIEARLAAEAPEARYRPETGRITGYKEPAGPNLRIDSGVEDGAVIGPRYDSMLAKVVAHAPSRDVARRQLIDALETYEITGVGTNRAFLRDLLTLPDFVEGRHDTCSIDRAFPDGWSPQPPSDLERAVAVLARYLDDRAVPKQSLGPWNHLGAWRLTAPAGCYSGAVYRVGEDSVRIEERGDIFSVAAPSTGFDFAHVARDGAALTFEQGGLRTAMNTIVDGSSVVLSRGVRRVTVEVGAAGGPPLNGVCDAQAAAGPVVRAPMPGAVAEVCLGVGDDVQAGQTVVVLEAMKLMQQLAAPHAGRIQEITVEPGDNVEDGAVLAIIAPETARESLPKTAEESERVEGDDVP